MQSMVILGVVFYCSLYQTSSHEFTMRFRLIVKQVLATSAVVGGASLAVWALPKLKKDEVYILS